MDGFNCLRCSVVFLVILSCASELQGCSDDQFTCANGRMCLPIEYKCNGIKDCDDGSDETTETCGTNCEKVDGRFACNSGQCVEEWLKCDGSNDCDDGSDETMLTCGTNCEKVEGRWACSNGQCVNSRFKCDGYKDCEDGSDETTETCVDN